MKKILCALLCLALSVPAFGAMSDADFLKLCRKGKAEEISAALKDGANIDARDKHEETPLMTAAAYNTPETVKVLLDAGAEVNAVGKEG